MIKENLSCECQKIGRKPQSKGDSHILAQAKHLSRDTHVHSPVAIFTLGKTGNRKSSRSTSNGSRVCLRAHMRNTTEKTISLTCHKNRRERETITVCFGVTHRVKGTTFYRHQYCVPSTGRTVTRAYACYLSPTRFQIIITRKREWDSLETLQVCSRRML